MDMAEQFAADYLKQHDLRAERFSKEEMRVSKTPDYRVFKQIELVAYCEAKHVQHDNWLDEQLNEGQPLQLVGGLRPDPVFNRLTAHIHKAAQQFAAVNPQHVYPNILVFANFDRACDFHDQLLGVLTGNFYGSGGVVEHIFEQFSNGRIREEKVTIDAYVWWDGWKKDLKPKHWYWHNSPHYANVCAILQTDPSAHVRVPPSQYEAGTV
jgi:hypothetical protein